MVHSLSGVTLAQEGRLDEAMAALRQAERLALMADAGDVLATICGKMRKRWVRITAGDRVKMEMSPYDLNKARITWRLR